MKLYFWDVCTKGSLFSNYTNGWAFAIAESPDHARRLIYNEFIGVGSEDSYSYSRFCDANSGILEEPVEFPLDQAIAKWGWGSS